MHPRIGLVFSLLVSSQLVSAMWPLGQKRFKANGLIGAGPLGLGDADGRVAAFGDFNGDQFLDVVTLSEDQQTLTLYTWNHDDFFFYEKTILHFPTKVLNVVPGDFTHDGKLDLLVMSVSSDSSNQISMGMYLGTPDGLSSAPISMPPSTTAQPIPLDSNGDMRIDLLGLSPSGSSSYLKLWQNTWDNTSPSNATLFTQVDPSFVGGEPCELADPHSSAVLDFDGDCLADLFLVCKGSQAGQLQYQIWLNDKTGSFVYSQGGQLPTNIGAISFADMDRDGTLDMVFPTCDTISSVTGSGKNCYINIVYNKQKPLCTTTNQRNCRPPEALCTSDPSFTFDFSDIPSNDAYSKIPVAYIVSQLKIGVAGLLISDMTYRPSLPVALKIGDADLDGFPDILTIVSYLSQYRMDNKPWMLRSVPCDGKPLPNNGRCAKGRRSFELVTHNVEALASINDARSVSFLDMDEDGTLDILVQRTGMQTFEKLTFIQNNFFYDSFFLKAIVLNGACDGWCQPINSTEPKYHPFGVSYSGATYKYTVIDTNGGRSAAQVAQLPQTSYHSLLTPYSFFGLGRTNNYIENLFVGSTRHSAQHFINMEGVIPNSKVVIMPPSTDDAAWRKELYLRPGQWIPWVMLTVIVSTIILAVIVFVLHLNEKREDEMERRRALHDINFDAL
ncbi:hypothetical protein FRB94_010289 [Tulasnella sp. JGI-2019a]|nr:hypothetical protein FRB94_010289 [Tulasnella sp. JGI-2019a]KAG9012343.1 hypothetical protein FRB93_001765 [Tulasnella sp. JGI-2019a]KAG9036156.1 hypothetical protein FRB95_009730 [Tulasnella sp. JGI-2019a]